MVLSTGQDDIKPLLHDRSDLFGIYLLGHHCRNGGATTVIRRVQG
jgi:hypothetical protein